MTGTEETPAAATASGSQEQVQRVSEIACDRELKVATAESLTSGAVASALGAGPGASTWFAGGIVAYDSRVKFDLLGVEEGPVITERCARQMAEGAAKVLGADAVVATTGAGGPDPEEGEPAGTAYLAVTVCGHTSCRRVQFDGDPEHVVEHTTREAVRMLREAIEEHHR